MVVYSILLLLQCHPEQTGAQSDKCLGLNKTDLCIVITNTTNKYKKQKQYAYVYEWKYSNKTVLPITHNCGSITHIFEFWRTY